MRVTQVMLSARFGGAERYFVDLARVLARAGHAVQAICRRGSDAAGALAGEAGIDIVQVRVLGAWDPFAVRAVRAAIARHGAQVVHAHLARATHVAGKALRGSGVPLVTKTHNYVDLAYYTGVDAFITTTQDQARYLREHGVDAARIDVIPNFSAVPAVGAAAPARAPDAPLRLLAYGRFVPKKGFDRLLHALSAVVGAGIDAELVLGGDGPERARLQALAVDLGLAPRVHMVGWIGDVAAALAAADAFVLPSLDEPFGIAVLEAMARGVPVIATGTRGPLEILDASCAVLVPIGDAAALAAALRALAADPAAAQALAAAALARYREHYSVEVVVPRILALYARLVSGGQQAGSP